MDADPSGFDTNPHIVPDGTSYAHSPGIANIDRQCLGDLDPDRDRYADCDADTHADRHGDVDLNRNGHSDADRDTHANSDRLGRDEHACHTLEYPGHAFEHTGHTFIHGYLQPNTDCHLFPDLEPDREFDINQHVDGHRYARADADGHAHADAHLDADRHAYTDADRYAHLDGDGHAHADAHLDADRHAYTDADGYAHLDADRHAHVDADRHAHVDADRHGHADQYAVPGRDPLSLDRNQSRRSLLDRLSFDQRRHDDGDLRRGRKPAG